MYNLKKSITEACKRKRITKNQLALEMQVANNQIQIWQSRNAITISNAAKIAQATGLTLSEFIALGEA